jgi:predicted transcriptional regulator
MYKCVKISNNIISDYMKVKDIMSKNLIICSSDINVINISNIMKKYNIGFIPIEKNKKIIGVITDRDIVINIISNKVNNNSSIESYVNSNIIHIEENSSIDECLNIMKENKVKRLIVVNKEKIVGVISLSDILNCYDDLNKVTEVAKVIWSTTKSDDNYKTEIDEFYL